MKQKIIWISIIVGILAIPCLFYGIMLMFVVIYPVTFEPNYEQKAANWDQIRRQEQQSQELGWVLHLETTPGDQRHQVNLLLRLEDRHGNPITDATVGVEAFHTAYTSKVIQPTMQSTEGGVYQATMRVKHSGAWKFHVTAKRQDDLFLQTLQRHIDNPSRR